jgi:hypothetical protein
MSESVSDDATIGRDHIEQRQRQADDCRAARCEHLAGLLDRLVLKRIRLESMVNRGPAGEFANDPQPNLLNTLDLFLRPIIIWRRAVTVALQQ